KSVTHGWTPENGFLPYRWEGYSEALLLYVLALGSPTHAIPQNSYAAWASTYQWKKSYGIEYLYAGPLFIHQFSQLWIDFRGIQDAFMRDKSIDYFENSRRATQVQQQYAIHNPRQFAGYNEHCWGISASDGPGPATRRVRSKTRHFYGYRARGVPSGPDDGTIAPWAAAASLPFAPEIVLPVLRSFDELHLRAKNRYGYKATFNPTFRTKNKFWVSPHHLALNQGPVVLMIENFRTGLIWRLMRNSAPILRGLKLAGFTGGWLDAK
ncbi:MAG TPA: glucoamylase family protein, partial [Phycisphaerae bacterium]